VVYPTARKSLDKRTGGDSSPGRSSTTDIPGVRPVVRFRNSSAKRFAFRTAASWVMGRSTTKVYSFFRGMPAPPLQVQEEVRRLADYIRLLQPCLGHLLGRLPVQVRQINGVGLQPLRQVLEPLDGYSQVLLGDLIFRWIHKFLLDFSKSFVYNYITREELSSLGLVKHMM